MLDNLTSRLSKVVKTLRGEARLTETNMADMLREVRLAMLEADVALPVVRDFIAKVKEKAQGLVLDAGNEVAHDGQRHVGLEQGHAHFAQHVGPIGLGDAGLSADFLDQAGEFVGEC